jgi:membrane protein DedA with SNARE-associated domain
LVIIDNPVSNVLLTRVSEINARTRYILFSVLFLATTAISIILMIRYSKEIAQLQHYGYLGAFLIAFIAGCSIPSPISYLILVFTLGGIPGLQPALVGIAGGVGAGLGGPLVYLLGRQGRLVLPSLKHYSLDQEASNKMAAKFVDWAQRRGSVVVFAMSAMLNPVFAPMAIALGALRFKLINFFIMCIAGNLVKAMVISYAGYLGIGTLLRWLGRV